MYINTRFPHLTTSDSSNTMISLDNFLVGIYIVLKSRGKKTVNMYEASKARQEKKEINNS